MRTLSSLVLCVCLLVPAMPAAKNFRWASQGDAATMDPHGRDEIFSNGLNNLVYESLVAPGKDLRMEAALATSWSNPIPAIWIFNLRKGVKWHDGSPFTADDVLFSFNRARESAATFKLYASQAGAARKIDDHTVEFTTPAPNPVMANTVAKIFILSRAWCEKNKVEKAQDYAKKEETYAVRNAMGTGPYRLERWEPGVKLLHRRNSDWWGHREGLYEGNVETIEYTPIASAATRMAALKSGRLDFLLDPSVQDVPRLREDRDVKVWEGSENRVLFIGLDQARQELLYADVKGRNPFKDKRVRLALYQAIDVGMLKTQVMRGLSVPTGIVMPNPSGGGVPDSYEVRHPYDPAASRRLLAEAGYPNGFGFTLSCPNDRWVNDERICVALAAMWARIGVNVKVEAMTKAHYFPKAQNRDVSAYLLGWGGANTDAIFIMKPVLHSRNSSGAGDGNYGDASNDELDALIDRLEVEMNPAERQAMINRAVRLIQEEVHVIPLHRQVIPWASRSNVSVVHRADNVLNPVWVKIR